MSLYPRRCTSCTFEQKTVGTTVFTKKFLCISNLQRALARKSIPPPFAPPQIPCGAQSMRCKQAHHVLPFTTLQLLVASFRWCTLQEETAQAECRVGDRHENKAHGAGDDDDPHDVRVSRVADVCDSLHVIRLAKTSAKEGTGSSARVGGLRERQRTERRRRRRERDTAMEE